MGRVFLSFGKFMIYLWFPFASRRQNSVTLTNGVLGKEYLGDLFFLNVLNIFKQQAYANCI